MSTTAIARNAPCPCGSGKRFKDCHGTARSALSAPPSAEALLASAQVAFAAGRSTEAEAALRDLLRTQPDNVAAWNLLGECLKTTDPTAAGDAWWRALEIDPDNAEAAFHLGNLNLERGRHAAALIHYERALRGAPDHVSALNNLGLCHKALGATDRAEQSFRAALAAEPAQPDALVNLTNLLFARERYTEVVHITDRILASPHAGRGSISLVRALAQERSGDTGGAEATLLAAVAQRPDDATLQAYLGTLYARRERYGKADEHLSRSVDLAPHSAYALSMLAHVRQQRCAWSGLSALFEHLQKLLETERGEGPVPVDAFSALAMPLSPLAQLHVAQRWARMHAMRGAERPVVDIAPGERLRVAFVSSNFRDHATMHLSAEFFEKIDRSRLETFAYSLRASEDRYQQRARAAFEHFADVSNEPTPRIAQRIRDDRIAILIDRNGYTLHAREGIFALRPAPIQINCIGFPGTLGAEWYDYIFTDRFSLPGHLQRFYSERPLYMPHMSFPSDTTRLPEGTPPSRAACGLPERGFVFCCFNHAYKILPEVFAVWMRLLAGVPGSVLWLLDTGEEAKANLRRAAATAGIAAERLIFAPRLAVGAHLTRHAAADLFLDTFPYGAHTTANDALLAGLPLLTRVGETLASRIAGSQLTAIGLPELITASLEEYEALAYALAADGKRLAGYRQRLAENRRRRPLFDMDRYARDFETAMQQAWEDHRLSLARRTAQDSPTRNPDDPEALFHRGNRRRARGDAAGAIADYERALERAPGHAALLNNLGLALEAIGQTDRAQSCYREILARDPQHADALLNLANVLATSARFAEAAELHSRAAAVRRDLAPAVWVQRALAQERIRDFAGAEASLREAVRLAPDDARIHANLATLLVQQRRHAEAETPLQRVLAIDPQNAQALSMLAYVRQQRCAWDGLSDLHRRIGALLDRSDAPASSFNPFPLLAMPMSPRQLQIAARSWARGFAPPASGPELPPVRGGRLRVGFVSSDFRPHATTHLLLEFWEHLDRRRIETFAYAIARPDPDDSNTRIRDAFEHFADVAAEPAHRIAQRIRDDGVVIVFDLNGYTRLAREPIFALRAAPVQVNAFGYLGTLGAPWYDYVLGDSFATPPGAQTYFDERFLLLDCYCPAAVAREVATDAGTRATHGLPEGGFVFCCFNSSYKLLPDVFARWMRLLATVPGSVLWLTQARGESPENLRREAARCGIDPARLVFAPRVPLPQHLARHVHADLFLDTTPYNAGATANDALVVGLPVVTCSGETMSSRVAGSQLRAAGLPELVTTTLDEYEALALALARDSSLLAGYRSRLVANRATAPLFDVRGYARGFEDALLRLRDTQAPAPD